MSTTEPRPYRASDRAGCLAVFDSNRPRYFTAEERPLFERFLDALPGPYFVIEEGNGVILACGGWATEETGRIASFCWGMVRQDRHGQGLGRQLTVARLASIRADPRIGRVRLDTSQHTRGFYAGMGFQVLSVEADGYAPGMDRCEMELDLSGPRPAGA